MSIEEVDAYLAELDETKRATLAELRASILRAVPEAEQGMSYGSPAFRLGGKSIAGFAAAKKHLSYLPHSGSVLPAMTKSDLGGLEASKGALKFAVDQPLPDELVERLITARRAEAGV